MKYTYFFIPGRNRSLSKTELKSVCSNFCTNRFQLVTSSEKWHLLVTDSEIDEINEIFHRLGGYIKFGIILDKDLDLRSFSSDDSRVIFGVSAYSAHKDSSLNKERKKFIRNIKDGFRSLDKSSRYIGSGKTTLSAGQIVGSELLSNGFELVMLKDEEGHLSIGKTIAVQDIEGFSLRDYEKPYTDVDMGVLPPKLARIMINLAKVEEAGTIWDPFCGSGSVLLEGLLLGYDVVGSDIDGKAVHQTKENIRWLGENFKLGEAGFNVFKYDVTKHDKYVQNKLQNTPLDAIIFEPYMGPPLKSPINKRYAKELLENIKVLYEGLLNTAEHIKKYDLTIVCVVPSYKTKDGWVTIRFNELFSKRWEIEGVDDNDEGLHWDRSNSIIRRNLLIAKQKN